MRRSIVVAVVAVPVACAAAALATFHADAGPPVVTSVTEGVEAGSGRRVVFLVGRQVDQIQNVDLRNQNGFSVGAVKTTLKTASVVSLRLPAILGSGPYDLSWNLRGSPAATYRIAEPTGLEGMRVVRGRVNPDGSCADGTGFTCARILEGNYGMGFDVPFSAPPTIVATPYGGFNDASARAHTTTGSDFGITTWNNGGTADVSFYFIAIGPR